MIHVSTHRPVKSLAQVGIRLAHVLVILSMILSLLGAASPVQAAASSQQAGNSSNDSPARNSDASLNMPDAAVQTVDETLADEPDSLSQVVPAASQPSSGPASRAVSMEAQSQKHISRLVRDSSLSSIESTWMVTGSAMTTTIPGRIVLTSGVPGQTGAAWNSEPITLTRNFEKSFMVYLGNNDDRADGIVFAFQGQKIDALGCEDFYLGYSGITPSMGVEIDTHWDWVDEIPLRDPLSDHMGIHVNGVISHTNSYPAKSFTPDIEDGHEHWLGVRWDAHATMLYVYWDGLLAIRSVVTPTFTTGWYGFTGANGFGDLGNLQYFYETDTPVPDMSSGSQDDRCFNAVYKEDQEDVGGPINTHNGGYDYAVEDLSFQTAAGVLSFERTYSSLQTGVYTTTLGYGWTHNQDVRLIFSTFSGEGQEIQFKGHTTNRYIFYDYGDGKYVPYAGLCATLMRDGENYVLKDRAQRVYTFDESGKLTSYQDPQGHTLYYIYDQGRLQYVSDRPDPEHDSQARYLKLSYGIFGRIIEVMDHHETAEGPNRHVHFDYSAAGDLTTVTDVLAQSWTYVYSDTHVYTPTHLLAEVYNPLNQIIERTEYDYDAQGRAVRQYDGESDLVVELGYDLDGTTVVSETVDGQVYTSTHIYDARRTLTGIENAQANTTQKTYDPNFRPLTVTDPLKHTTNMAWSADGLDLQRLEDAAGNTTTLSYDSLHNLTQTVDGRGYATTHTYIYTDGLSLLKTSIDAVGNTTIYTYTTSADTPQPSGLLKAVEDSNHHLTSYLYDSYGQRIAMIENGSVDPRFSSEKDTLTRYGYDDLGRPISVTLPGGRTNWTCYNDAGHVVRTVSNVSSPYSDPCSESYPRSTDPLYDQVTETIYDAAGRAIASIDSDNRITRMYYDAAGRPIWVVRNLSNWGMIEDEPPVVRHPELLTPIANLTSQTVYGVGGQAIASIEWLVEGTAVISHTTRTFYDSLGRPVTMTLNFTGDLQDDRPPAYNSLYPDRNVSTYTTYDEAGNVIVTTDALGRKTRTYYDELNRPALVLQGWNGSAQCNRSEGAVSNICSETKYDANGNVIATRDAREVITRTYYDALNRPVLVLRNAAQAWEDIDEQDAPPPASQFGNGANVATGTLYSGSRAIASVEWLVVDSQVISHATRAYYDDQGRLYLTVRNLNPSYDVYNDEPPTCNRDTSGLVDPYNICTEMKYDAETGQAIASLDPLERVTRTYYDVLDRPYLVIRNLTVQTYTLDMPPEEPGKFGNDHDVASQTIYDERGQAIASLEWWIENEDAFSRTTRTYYDVLGRPVSVVQHFVGDLQDDDPPAYNPLYPDRNVRIDTVYASDGRAIANIEWLADASGEVFTRTTRTYYDALGRATLVVQNLNPAWDYRSPTPPTCNHSKSSGGVYELYNVCQETVYNAAGQVTQRKDALEKVTTYYYDALGRLSDLIDPVSSATRYSYNANGNRVSVRNAEAVVTRFEYDALGRMTGVTENYLPPYNPGNQTNVYTEYGYDALGNRLVITDALSHPTTFAYDALGRLASEADALSHTWEYGYDVAGNRVWMTDANGSTTAYAYDGLNRPVSVNYPAPDADAAFSYNALGWRTVMTDGLGVTAWTYDWLGRPITITQPASGIVGYRYNAQGNRTKLIYPDGKQAVYVYDTLDRLAQVTDWASQVVTYSHDVAGNLVQTGLPNAVKSASVYDDAGRLLSIAHVSGDQTPLSSFVYAYDPLGNRTAVTETVADLAVSFADGFESGNLSAWDSSVTDGGDLSVSTQAALQGTYGLKAVIDDNTSIYVVDDGPEAAVRYQASFSFSFGSLSMGSLDVFKLFQGYDASGAAAVYIEVKKSAANTIRISASALDDSGRACCSMTSDNLSQVVTHTVRIEWKAATAPGANDGNLALWVDGQPALGFCTNGIDNDTRRIDTVRFGAVEGIDTGTRGWYALDKFQSDATRVQRTHIDYTYDPLGRLTEADYGENAYYEYLYDAVGNRQSETTAFYRTNYTYDDANRLDIQDGVRYTWDANGNLLSDGVKAYTYDHANRLTALNGQGTTASFAYNGLGDRTRQTVNSVTTNYKLDLAAGLTQVLADNNHTYLYGLGRISQHTSTQTEYFLGDALGSLRQLVDATEKVTLVNAYQPYGKLLGNKFSGSGSSSSSYGFAGEWRDSSGLVYLRARYYAPGQGRFISRDVWKGDYEQPMSYNAWLYAYANPLTYVDPSGMRPGVEQHPGDPPEINPNQLQVVIVNSTNNPDIKIDQDCPLPINVIRTVIADLSLYVGYPRTSQVVFSYDLEKATRPVPFGDVEKMRETGEQSVVVRTVLVEETGWRMLHNVHAVADAAGIIFTAVNRTANPNPKGYKCSSVMECMLRPGAYALMAAQFGWDPMCYGEYGNCQNAYGSGDQYEWMRAIDFAATAYHLVRQNLIADFTYGATDFAYTSKPHAGIAFYSSTDHRISERLAYISCVTEKQFCSITEDERRRKDDAIDYLLPKWRYYSRNGEHP